MRPFAAKSAAELKDSKGILQLLSLQAGQTGGISLDRNIQRFFDSLKSKRVAFIGVGVTNTGIIRMLLQKGVAVTVLDRREADAMGEDYVLLREAGARFSLGEGYLDSLTDFDVVFRAPGVYYLSQALMEARDRGVAVTSEMEVFFDLCPCPVYAVTGSDGKTTTTTLISEFLKASGKTVHLGGNIGRALLPEIESIRPEDVCVVELSSFQLLSMRQSPDVAVIKNVTPNHLDVHRDMAEYTDAKKNILLHQNAFSRAVLNLDNGVTREMAPLVRGKLSWFSMQTPPESWPIAARGAFLDGEGWLCRTEGGKRVRLLHKDELQVPGMHNVENMLTAIAAVQGEVDDESIRRAARAFTGVEHRLEFVRELDGVRYINGSIASSPTRTIADLRAFSQKLIIIAGGYDKKIPYAPLGPVACERAKAVVLMGATGPKIEEAIRSCPEFPESGLVLLHASDMEDAVRKARSAAVPGDIVVLSPASASFDLYRNFEERGKHYKRIVNSL